MKVETITQPRFQGVVDRMPKMRYRSSQGVLAAEYHLVGGHTMYEAAKMAVCHPSTVQECVARIRKAVAEEDAEIARRRSKVGWRP